MEVHTVERLLHVVAVEGRIWMEISNPALSRQDRITSTAAPNPNIRLTPNPSAYESMIILPPNLILYLTHDYVYLAC